MLLHVLAHVDPHHRGLVIKQKLRQRSRRLRLAHTRRPQKNKRPNRPLRITEPRARSPNRIRHRAQPLILPHHPLPQTILHLHQLLHLALQHLRHRNARPLRHNRRNILLVHLLLQHPPRLLSSIALTPSPVIPTGGIAQRARSGGACPELVEGTRFSNLQPTKRRILRHRRLLRLGQRPQLRLRLRDLAILQLRRPLQIALARLLRLLKPQPLQPLLQLRNPPDRPALLLPPRPQPGHRLLHLRQLALHHLQPLPRGRIRLPRQRRPLNLKRRRLPLQIINLHRHTANLDRQRRRRLIHQINRLVWQKTVRYVTVRERRRRHNRRILDPHLVVRLIALLQPAQNRHRILDIRLAHIHNLKPPFERRILLDVLAILIQRRRANRPQPTARQRRLQHVARVHRTFRRASAHQSM